MADQSSRYQKNDIQNRRIAGSRTDQSLVGRRETKRYEDERMMQPARIRKRSLPLTVFSWAFQILIVIIAAYLLVYFFGQSRTVIGSSMDTTLSGGDEVLINILAYQLNGPKQGDIISYQPNSAISSRSSIKRVIGLPGQKIQITDGVIYIDDKIYLEEQHFPTMTTGGMAETPVRLADNEYFVLGDNRNNSEDSRFAEVGMITSDMIEGKVWFIMNPSSRRGFLRG